MLMRERRDRIRIGLALAVLVILAVTVFYQFPGSSEPVASSWPPPMGEILEIVTGGFKLLAHKTSKEVVSGLTPQLDD